MDAVDSTPSKAWRASRPNMPGYGLLPEDEGAGLLPWSWASERLDQARNYWVVTASSSAEPHAAPVWGVWHESTFYFSTGERSKKGRNLAQSPRIVVHLESGDDVVILDGVAERLQAGALPKEVVARYQDKYDVSLDEGLTYSVEPDQVFAWRETDFPGCATRWQRLG